MVLHLNFLRQLSCFPLIASVLSSHVGCELMQIVSVELPQSKTTRIHLFSSAMIDLLIDFTSVKLRRNFPGFPERHYGQRTTDQDWSTALPYTQWV